MLQRRLYFPRHLEKIDGDQDIPPLHKGQLLQKGSPAGKKYPMGVLFHPHEPKMKQIGEGHGCIETYDEHLARPPDHFHSPVEIRKRRGPKRFLQEPDIPLDELGEDIFVVSQFGKSLFHPRRRAQFALLRVLGVTRGRLAVLIVAEGALVGIAGSLIGLALGFAPSPSQAATNTTSPSISFNHFYIITSYGFGVLNDSFTFKNNGTSDVQIPALQVGLLSRITRSTMLEVLRQDYVRTARAKGLPNYLVVGKHALANAMIPIVTVIGIILNLLLSGSVVTETVFSIPGVGQLLTSAILNRDYPMVQGGLLFLTILLVGINIFVDIAYAWLDPRVRYHGG